MPRLWMIWQYSLEEYCDPRSECSSSQVSDRVALSRFAAHRRRALREFAAQCESDDLPAEQIEDHCPVKPPFLRRDIRNITGPDPIDVGCSIEASQQHVRARQSMVRTCCDPKEKERYFLVARGLKDAAMKVTQALEESMVQA